jgi:hypothetical protein
MLNKKEKAYVLQLNKISNNSVKILRNISLLDNANPKIQSLTN